jgi:tRNA(Ile)-lysidine synthase
LFWAGEKPTVGIEEKAREARYDLLLTACEERQIQYLCLAHHQNDQAETFLMRLARSSGVDGLSAIQSVSKRKNIFLIRPFLDYPRTRIQKTLAQHFHIRWIEDPSNSQTVYERVRLRQFQANLDNLGLTASSIALSAKRLSRARQALEWQTDFFMKTHTQKNKAGFIFVEMPAFSELPMEIQLRVLDKSMAFVVGKNYQSRMTQLEKMLENMPCRLTLHDCQIVSQKKGFYVCAEYAKMPVEKQVKSGKETSWGRFMVLCDQNVKIAPLGDALKIKGLPALVRRTIPAFFDEKGLAFVPSIDYKRENTDINGKIEIKD